MTKLIYGPLLTTAIALSVGLFSAVADATEEGKAKMKDLESVDELKTQFNADAGQRRLLLLLSPT